VDRQLRSGKFKPSLACRYGGMAQIITMVAVLWPANQPRRATPRRDFSDKEWYAAGWRMASPRREKNKK
jgi:hypothetical protein